MEIELVQIKADVSLLTTLVQTMGDYKQTMHTQLYQIENLIKNNPLGTTVQVAAEAIGVTPDTSVPNIQQELVRTPTQQPQVTNTPINQPPINQQTNLLTLVVTAPLGSNTGTRGKSINGQTVEKALLFLSNHPTGFAALNTGSELRHQSTYVFDDIFQRSCRQDKLKIEKVMMLVDYLSGCVKHLFLPRVTKCVM
jgi:hypothetical protein